MSEALPLPSWPESDPDGEAALRVIDAYFEARAANSEAALAATFAPGLFIGPPGNPQQLRDYATTRCRASARVELKNANAVLRRSTSPAAAML